MKPWISIKQIAEIANNPAHADRVNSVALVAELCISATEFKKLPAARQRELFNGAPFGRRAIMHNPKRGGFEVRRIVAYGQDWADSFWSYAEIAALIIVDRDVVGYRD